ncbi:VWA domain-containing protein [Rhodoferax sp. 4810]|uniref:VWA domain-containing protein n=1 Tax=Thiospirillum jenense TaxID=1653858 RepID=A0A839HCF2_9GAMM|nr:VWA domain-containing protein [Thiospirillum jenense]MBB1073120.1 VWA domain-containing protein [Rhodoferax jenense]MBB1124719.1 VWA domain-containing protein [Thiospirillum jenense]
MTLTNFIFAHSWVFIALPLPALVYWLLPPPPPTVIVNENDALYLPAYAALLNQNESADYDSSSLPKRRWLFALAIIIWCLLIITAARPQWLGEPIALPVSGRDLLLAVDISGSMSEEDMVISNRVVDRLTAVKAVAGDFIERRIGDRVGLILFGQQAYLQAPLTFDRKTVRTLLFEAAIGLAGRETAVGDSIGLAVKRLRTRAAMNPDQLPPVLILLTDGANTAGVIAPQKAAELAAAAKIRIYTIGIGAEPRGFGLLLGNNPLDEETLTSIANLTGGRYFRARDVQELQRIYALLDQIEPVASDQTHWRPFKELFAWPLALALLLSIVLTRLVMLNKT